MSLPNGVKKVKPIFHQSRELAGGVCRFETSKSSRMPEAFSSGPRDAGDLPRARP